MVQTGRLFLGMAVSLLLLSPATPAESPSPERGLYPLPAHGTLRLPLPEGWRVSTGLQADPPALQLRIEPPKGDAFTLQMTAVWLTAERLAVLTPEKVRADTIQAATVPLQRSEERIATPEEFRGAESEGYYFSLTNRSAAPGDYKYLVQGITVTGEVMLVFSFQYREKPCVERDEALQMLANSSYIREHR
jgi:hypothetical protein